MSGPGQALRHVIALTLASAISTLLAACAAVGPLAEPVPRGTISAAAPLTPTTPRSTGARAAPTDAPLREVARPSMLRLALTEPPTLDPAEAEDGASIEIISQLFDPLLEIDERGVARGLAAQSWSVSPDGLTYTFRLRSGATWSDGRPVVANDFAWAWRRLLGPRPAPFASLLLPIKHAAAILEGTLAPDQLGVLANDDRILLVTLEQPAAHFPRLAANWALAPVRRDVVEAFGAGWTETGRIVTNGSYRLNVWEHGSRLVLQRGDAAQGMRPAIAQVSYRIFPPGGSDLALAAYQADELDVSSAGRSLELDARQVARARADPLLRDELRTLDRSTTIFLAMNHRQPHLQNVRVRRALGQSLDRQAMLELLRDNGVPARGLQPPGIAGRDPVAWPSEDPAAARQLLAEAGYPDGYGLPELTFFDNRDDGRAALGDYLQRRWREVLGVRLRIERRDWSQLLALPRTDEWARHGDLMRVGWFSEYEDPYVWHNALWDEVADPSAFNTGWRDVQYAALIRQGAAEGNPGRREALYAQAEVIQGREYPAIPLFHYTGAVLLKRYVRGYEPDRVTGATPLRRMTIGP